MKKVNFAIVILLILSTSFHLFAQRPDPINSLPPLARTFLETHFKHHKIYRVKFDIKKGECEVKLEGGIEIEFDYNGNWIEIEGEIQPLPKSVIDLLPSNIMVYIARNYPRRAILKIERESYGYEVELSNSAELQFDRKGKFLGED